MKKSPLRELRERLGLSRPEFAKLIGKKEAIISVYEAELPVEWANDLADIAAQHGFTDLMNIFEQIAGRVEAKPVTDFALLDDSQRQFLEACLDIYNSQVSDSNASFWVKHTYGFFDLMRKHRTRSKSAP